jgi:hypothetical protein
MSEPRGAALRGERETLSQACGTVRVSWPVATLFWSVASCQAMFIPSGPDLVSVISPPGARHLLPEAVPEIGVVGQLGPDHLHRDRAAALGECQVHPAHAARAQPGADPVAGDLARIITR